MTSGANGGWVRQGTPHDDDADWNQEPSEYGTAVSPVEWDDYASEQSAPVVPPEAASDGDTGPQSVPVPGQEPDAEEEYRSEETPVREDAPQGDADDDGLEPVRIDEPVDGDDRGTGFDDAAGESGQETTRPRPVAAGATVVQQDDADTTHVEAADYLAVDPEPAVVDRPDDPKDGPALHEDDDMEATQAVPVTGMAPAPAVPAGLYRPEGSAEPTVVARDGYPEEDDDVEEERLQARLAAERQAREQRLGAVPTSPENATREDVGFVGVTTDRFLPSFGLFVLRIVTAGILGLTSFQILGSGVDATATFLEGYPLIPEPRLVAWILGFTLGAMALLLVIGLLQRVVGFLLLAIAVAALVFIRWGNFAVFSRNVEGFIGDKDLLLAAVGLLLLCVGGGAWGVDGAFRRSRAAARAERQD